MSKKLLNKVKRQFKSSVVDTHTHLGDDTLVIEPEGLLPILEYLRDDKDAKMNLLRDVTAVDYLNRMPRFEVVYVLYSIELKHQLILRVLVEEDSPKVPTAAKLYPISGWLEREVWDMYGIEFTDHADLRRVLMYEEFDGHPLRKDYPIQGSQPRVELRARERDSVEEFKHYYKEEEAGGSRENY